MDPVQAKLIELEKKLDATHASVEKLRKYFLWTGIITLAILVLPILILPFVLGQFLSMYSEIGGLL